MSKADELLRRSIRITDEGDEGMQLVIVLPSGKSAWMGCYEPDSIAANVLLSLAAYLNEKPHEHAITADDRVACAADPWAILKPPPPHDAAEPPPFLRCQLCGLPIAKCQCKQPAEIKNAAAEPDSGLPLYCPTCGEETDSIMREQIRQSAFHAAAEPEKPVAWHVHIDGIGDSVYLSKGAAKMYIEEYRDPSYKLTPLYAAVQQPIARDEFICARCGIRVDSTHDKGDF